MQIAICDDDRKICDVLAPKLKRLVPEADIDIYVSGEELIEKGVFPDILLLDIKMPGMDGMEAARVLRDSGWKKILIFITGEETQVFDAFDVRAFQFLVKPFSDEKPESVIDDAIKHYKEWERAFISEDRFISVKALGENIRINLSEVYYAEVFDRKTIIHTTKENIEYYGQLSELETLTGECFYRIHRSYLVNLKFVERYDANTAKLTDKTEIPIARRSYPGFLKAYMEYNWKRGQR